MLSQTSLAIFRVVCRCRGCETCIDKASLRRAVLSDDGNCANLLRVCKALSEAAGNVEDLKGKGSREARDGAEKGAAWNRSNRIFGLGVLLGPLTGNDASW